MPGYTHRGKQDMRQGMAAYTEEALQFAARSHTFMSDRICCNAAEKGVTMLAAFRLLATLPAPAAWMRVLSSSRGDVATTDMARAADPAMSGAYILFDSSSASRVSYMGRYMQIMGTEISTETLTPCHRTEGPSCRTIFQRPSMQDLRYSRHCVHVTA